jgi:hypothetical protein
MLLCEKSSFKYINRKQIKVKNMEKVRASGKILCRTLIKRS